MARRRQNPSQLPERYRSLFKEEAQKLQYQMNRLVDAIYRDDPATYGQLRSSKYDWAKARRKILRWLLREWRQRYDTKRRT